MKACTTQAFQVSCPTDCDRVGPGKPERPEATSKPCALPTLFADDLPYRDGRRNITASKFTCNAYSRLKLIRPGGLRHSAELSDSDAGCATAI